MRNGAGLSESKADRPPLTVVRAPERPARDELEACLTGWQVRKPEWFGGAAANAIFRELRAEFRFSDPLLELCQRALDAAADKGLPLTPQHISAGIAAENPGLSEADLLDYLRSWSLGAPAVASEVLLRREVAHTLDLLRQGMIADRRRQADEMLRASGVEVFDDVCALLKEPTEGLGEPHCLSAGAWCDRDLAPLDRLMGEWLSTTCRVMLVAQTGIGKTNLALAIAFGLADGSGFLHWRGMRSARVLFIDGEMSRRLMRSRIADAARRHGSIPEILRKLRQLQRPGQVRRPR
jgi:hypothetical protein